MAGGRTACVRVRAFAVLVKLRLEEKGGGRRIELSEFGFHAVASWLVSEAPGYNVWLRGWRGPGAPPHAAFWSGEGQGLISGAYRVPPVVV